MKTKFVLLSLFLFPLLSWAQWESLGDDIMPNGHRTWSIKLAPDASMWALSTFDNFPPTGETPIVHRSADEGITWTHTEIPEGLSTYGWDISPVDSMTAYITINTRGIFKTIDGGLTWNKLETYAYNPLTIHFFNENEGWTLGSDTLNGWLVMSVTTDGADSWTHIGGADWLQPPGTSLPEQDTTESLGFFLFAVNSYYDYKESSILIGTSKGNVWASNDKGYNWKRKPTPLTNLGLVASAVAVVDSNTYMVIGEYTASSNTFSSSNSYTTTDDGETWIGGNPAVAGAAIHHLPGTDSTFLLAGHNNFGNGIIGTAISYDMGDNWQTLDFEQRILSMDFIDSNTGIAACCNLDIWPTANGQIYKWNFELPTPTFEILSTDRLRLFPNPVSETLYLETDVFPANEYLRIEILTTDGRLVQQFQKYSAERTALPVADLSPGLYMLKITGESQIITQTFFTQ